VDRIATSVGDQVLLLEALRARAGATAREIMRRSAPAVEPFARRQADGSLVGDP
jgi:hypothetical protein